MNKEDLQTHLKECYPDHNGTIEFIDGYESCCVGFALFDNKAIAVYSETAIVNKLKNELEPTLRSDAEGEAHRAIGWILKPKYKNVIFLDDFCEHGTFFRKNLNNDIKS